MLLLLWLRLLLRRLLLLLSDMRAHLAGSLLRCWHARSRIEHLRARNALPMQHTAERRFSCAGRHTATATCRHTGARWCAISGLHCALRRHNHCLLLLHGRRAGLLWLMLSNDNALCSNICTAR